MGPIVVVYKIRVENWLSSHQNNNLDVYVCICSVYEKSVGHEGQ